MHKDSLRGYATATALLIVLNLAALILSINGFLAVWATAGDWFNVFGVFMVDGTIAYWIVFFWTCLVIGFLEGADMRRQQSAVAVPFSWGLAGGLYMASDLVLGFRMPYEHYLSPFLIAFLVLPVVAGLSAHHGHRFAEGRRRTEPIWLCAMLLVFFLLVFYNHQLFDLIPVELGRRIANWPL